MATSLVAYFSASGTTARVAETLARAASADLFEIAPANPYTAADLDWTDRSSRSTREMNDEASRPALAVDAPPLDGYDTIFVGFPSGGTWNRASSTRSSNPPTSPARPSFPSPPAEAVALGRPQAHGLPDTRRHRAARQAPQRRPERNHAAHVDRELVDRPPPARAFCHGAPHAWHAPQTKVG